MTEPIMDWPRRFDQAMTELALANRENVRLRGLIKVLCSDPSPFGSEAFQRTRDTVNPEYRALLLAVLNDRKTCDT